MTSFSFLWDTVVPVVMTAGILFFNLFSAAIHRIFHGGKAQINPRCLVVVITGCDSGFGELSAVRFSQMGFKVVAGCLTSAGAQRLKDSVAVSIECDITKDEDVAKLVTETSKMVDSVNGHLWAVVNNAGIATGGPLDWVTVDSYRKTMDVNFFGHVSVTKAMLPLLKQCGESRIINLSSVAGILGGANLSSYSASKHAMEGFMKSIAPELIPWHIYVCNINPAFMRYKGVNHIHKLPHHLYISPHLCRTPMVLNNVEKGMHVFKTAPAEVQSQYTDPRPRLSEGDRLVNSSAEVLLCSYTHICRELYTSYLPSSLTLLTPDQDPALVVDAIVDAATDLRPQMWYFPGRAASLFR